MKITLIIPICLVTLSCGHAGKDSSLTEKELLAADIAFSRMSELQGPDNAFEAYADDEAVFLRPGSYPIEGKSNVMEYYNSNSSKDVKLTWEPLKAFASSSGDLGYTYGLYHWQLDTVVRKGTYLSIWKKDKTGEWKYVLDTGNSGLGE